MFVFFTIPWIFVVMVILMVLGVGVSVLRFVLDHIIIISVMLWLPVAWYVWGRWRDKTVSNQEKVETALFSLSVLPAYAALFRLIEVVLDALENDLFAFFVYLLFAPAEFCVILLAGLGGAYVLSKLNAKFIQSKFVTVCLGILIAALATWYIWNLNWG